MNENVANTAKQKYQKFFPKKHSLVIAIHARELNETLENVKIASESGADGVFLVDHDMLTVELLKINLTVRRKYKIWSGLNILPWTPLQHFRNIKDIENRILSDGFRLDNPFIGGITVEKSEDESKEVDLRRIFSPDLLYFGGIGFKHQELFVDLETACKGALNHMDVVTTSGPGTGKAAPIQQIKDIRSYIGNFPMALASGVDKNNIHECFGLVDSFIVNTSISRDFHNLDPQKIEELAKIIDSNN